jgi:thiosulfate dehydrogenase
MIKQDERIIMKSTKSKVHLAVGAASIGLLGAVSLWARPPFTDAQLANQQQDLLEVVNKGRDLWHGSNPEMSSNGLACGNCHPDAAASNPQTFPKWVSEIGAVAPLRDMINWCIVHPQEGKQLDVNSADMVALEAYAFYLYRGQTIAPGLAMPTPPDPVKSGVGFPRKPSGIGVDK